MDASELKSKLQKSLDFLTNELATIRTGRASPALIESIKVDAYDTKMSIREVGTITTIDAQTIVVSPWDKGLLQAIDKAVRDSDLGLNPVTDSDAVRVHIPDLTEERRKEFSKLVSTKLEDAKRSMRNIRQDAIKDIDKDFEAKKIGEDEKFTFREDVDETVKDFIQQAEEHGANKKEEVLKV